jgi:hypothetical protein
MDGWIELAVLTLLVICAALLYGALQVALGVVDVLKDLRYQQAGIKNEIERLRTIAAEIRGSLPD